MSDQQADASLKAHEIANSWLKHFITTLAIANAGAFATLATALLKIDDAQKLAEHVMPAMAWFAVGMLIAGLLPVIVWVHYKADSVLAAIHERGEYPAKALPVLREYSEYLAVLGSLVSMIAFGGGVWKALEAAGNFVSS